MPRRTGAITLMLPVRQKGDPANKWLYDSLLVEILAGRLRPGTRLPATRDFARQYGLSRGTIVNAIEQLKLEGYVEGVTGSGTYVRKTLPEELLHVTPTTHSHEGRAVSRRRRASSYGEKVSRFPEYGDRPIRAFRANIPDLAMFPTDIWGRLATRRWRRASAKLLLGCEASGYVPLRQAIAEYLVTSRGVRCTWQQVVVVAGVQEAIDLVARLWLGPGDRVGMENPGYPGAVRVFRALGAEISWLSVDSEGAVPDARRLSGARMVYVTPSHQFPLGVNMSLGRRLQIIAWARKENAIIFEDDYDSEFRYAARPIPALQGLDDNGVVVFAGSFSKVLFPALRLGYVVVPEDLVGRFEAAKSITTRHAQLLDQAVLTDFIAEGHFARHLRRMRQVYAERLSVLMRGAEEELAGVLTIPRVDAGLQTVGWLARGFDALRVAAEAAKRSVEVTALQHFSHGNVARRGLQIGFAAVDSNEIRRGLRELAGILAEIPARSKTLRGAP